MKHRKTRGICVLRSKTNNFEDVLEETMNPSGRNLVTQLTAWYIRGCDGRVAPSLFLLPRSSTSTRLSSLLYCVQHSFGFISPLSLHSTLVVL